MSETPLSAMVRFTEHMKKLSSTWTPPRHNTADAAVEETFKLLRPFLINPERHAAHVKLILEGLGLNLITLLLQSITRIFKWTPMRFLMNPFSMKPFESQWGRIIEEFLRRLAEAQADLQKSLTPVHLDADMLPPSTKVAEGVSSALRLIVFPINVSLYETEFEAQSLSVRLSALEQDFRFVDVEPSSRVENIGSYEINVSESGKFVEEKESSKMAFKLEGGVAKLEGEVAEENSASQEWELSVNKKRSGQQISSMVISSALKGVARWELLRTPSQPLVGGFRFFATAFVPEHFNILSVELRVSADLEGWGPYEIVNQHKVEIPLVASPIHAYPVS